MSGSNGRSSGKQRNTVVTEHFSLSWRRPSVSAESVLQTGIPKKLLPRSVDRNRVRRVIREAVRASGLQPVFLSVRLKVRPTQAFNLPAGACKRYLRGEIDAGIADLAARLAQR